MKHRFTTESLWPGGAPQARGTEITDQPELKIHLPVAEIAVGAAVVINPGGGFSKLASDNEGLHVAEWLNSLGIAAFVLRYRLRPDYEPPVALLDATRAIRYVRHNANRFDIDPDRIGMLGFSAGGHLTASLAISYDAGNPDATDPIDRVSSRPDFAVPIYPVIDEEVPGLVTPKSPPTFLVLTHRDLAARIKGALPFYEALLDNKVPAEMHVFNRGVHGTGMAPGDPSLGRWPKLFASWLQTSGFLTGKKRIAVQGSVTIDGKPLSWGGITLIPEDPNAPVAWVHSTGEFSIDAANGPVPGPHRVEVHILSKGFSHMKTGTYSMDQAESYRKPSPGAKEPLLVDIAADQEIQISVVTSAF
jgi:acetyl esterase/lipase